ncbi:hypothetical protein [Ferrovibrio sp.]|uniref:hypothetical protein n=1 Tax=Ferrovibrio sp. TaxID=1917215 RepID=UPI003D2D4B92
MILSFYPEILLAFICLLIATAVIVEKNKIIGVKGLWWWCALLLSLSLWLVPLATFYYCNEARCYSVKPTTFHYALFWFVIAAVGMQVVTAFLTVLGAPRWRIALAVFLCAPVLLSSYLFIGVALAIFGK